MTPEQQVEYINRQDRMNRIKKVAEMYANATPEQRAKVDASTVKSLINEYKELQEMQRQAEDMEQRAQLEAMRAQEEAQRAAAQWVGWGRRVVRTTPTNTPTPTPTPETITTGPQWYTYEEWGTIWYVDPNGNETAVAWRYPGYGKTPYEEQTSTVVWPLPAYDPRYDTQSNNYVYNKWHYNWKWQYVADPEYTTSYWMYDNNWNLLSNEQVAYNKAYADSLNTIPEKITWMSWDSWDLSNALTFATAWAAAPISSAISNTSKLVKWVNAAADNAVVANNTAKSLQYAQALQRAANRPLQVRNTVTNARNALVPVSEWRLYNPTYGNQYSSWAQDLKNITKWFNTSGYIPRSRAISVIPGNASNYTQTSLI